MRTKATLVSLLSASLALAQPSEIPSVEGIIIHETSPTTDQPFYNLTLRNLTGEETTIHIYSCPLEADLFLNLRDYVKIETPEIQNQFNITINKSAIFWKNSNIPYFFLCIPPPSKKIPKKEKKEKYRIRGSFAYA